MRESGILMHISSLPGPYGIGTMGETAYRFVDFLVQTGQSYWQILPLNPTGYGDSPYQGFCSAAGNHYLIDLDMLIDEGLLTRDEVENVFWEDDPGRVNYGTLYNNRIPVLKLAFDRFTPTAEFASFVEQNPWLGDYCLFMALKSHFEGKPWLDWPRELRDHEPQAIAAAMEEHAEEVALHQFLQFVFYRQWSALRGYAASKGIGIIGDVPIYVPLDSADVWSNPQLFLLDDSRRPTVVAGCPPDAFTADGQLWGNPIYNWEKMAQDGYAWWIRRLRAAEKLYDVVRIDHFRGFESYWSVPGGDTTARGGQWVMGPGMDFIRVVQRELTTLRFIAEDLGYITPGVRQLLTDSGYPGMKVMEFAFDSREESDYLPHLYPRHSVCYTGTHDNATLKQWFAEASPEDIAYAREYLGLNAEEGYVWGMIRGAMGSVSDLCIVQLQDYLELGKEARMNLPGTVSMDNWTWRAKRIYDKEKLIARIARLTKIYGRSNSRTRK